MPLIRGVSHEKLIWGLVCAFCLCGSPAKPVEIAETPTVNIPIGFHIRNWRGPTGQGSCVHASMIELFYWQGRPDLAELWRNAYSSGEHPAGLASKLEARGVRWAQTTSGDVSFLEWAIANRLGAAVSIDGGRHMVCLVHLDAERAGILDTNYPGSFRWMGREEFLAEWQASGLRWGVTPVYSAPPVLPK
jgi:hypothetical protein